jgi:hypothetical protein
MTRLSFFLIVLLSYAGPLVAQQLSPDEFLALGKYRLTRIDSIMTGKGFNKTQSDDKPDYTVNVYSYLLHDGAIPTQRSLHLGYRKKIQTLQVQYGVWQAAEAQAFIRQLEKKGFKTNVSSSAIPNMDGSSYRTSQYKRGDLTVTYEIMNQGSGVLLYIFSFDKTHYKA